MLSSDVHMRISSVNMKSCFQHFLKVFSSRDMKLSLISNVCEVCDCAGLQLFQLQNDINNFDFKYKRTL